MFADTCRISTYKSALVVDETSEGIYHYVMWLA